MNHLANCTALALLCCGLVSAAHADKAAMRLLNQVQEANGKAQTLTARLQYRVQSPFEHIALHGDMALQKPNLAVVNLDKGTHPFVLMADGQQVCTLDIAKRVYTLAHGEASQAIGIWPIAINPVELFFGLQAAEMEPDEQASLLPPARIVGVLCQVVVKWRPEKVFGSEETAKQFTKFYIGPDFLPRRILCHSVRRDPKLDQVYDFTLANVQVDRPIAKVTFSLSLPPDAKGPRQPAPTPDELLLPVGSRAPDFALPTPEGKEIALQDALSGKKALLVNFWGYH